MERPAGKELQIQIYTEFMIMPPYTVSDSFFSAMIRLDLSKGTEFKIHPVIRHG
jgi:hypothetical protein